MEVRHRSAIEGCIQKRRLAIDKRILERASHACIQRQQAGRFSILLEKIRNMPDVHAVDDELQIAGTVDRKRPVDVDAITVAAP